MLPKESPAQVYLAQADFEMRIGGLATAKGLLNKVYLFFYGIDFSRFIRRHVFSMQLDFFSSIR